MVAVGRGLELVLAPVAQALGHEYKGPRAEAPGRPPGPARKREGPTALDHADPAVVARAQQRDHALLHAARAAGIAIEL